MLGHLREAAHTVGADDERVRGVRIGPHRGDLAREVDGPVVVRQDDVGAGRRRHLPEPVRRLSVGLDVSEDCRAAPERGEMPHAANAHRDQERERPGRVPRRVVHRDGGLAGRHDLPIGRHPVAPRQRLPNPGIAAFGDDLPVARTHVDARVELLLQILRPTEVIAVPVRDQHVRDLGRVEAQPPHVVDDAADGVVERRVDQHDPGRSGDRPRRDLDAEQPVGRL